METSLDASVLRARYLGDGAYSLGLISLVLVRRSIAPSNTYFALLHTRPKQIRRLRIHNDLVFRRQVWRSRLYIYSTSAIERFDPRRNSVSNGFEDVVRQSLPHQQSHYDQ
jgi:hypothetical protein